MRAALKRDFKDLRQLLPVFDIFDNWLDRWADRGPFIGLSLENMAPQNSTSNSQKDPRRMIRNIEKRTNMPAPEHITRFLGIILDGYFVQLVQATESLPIVTRLHEKITESLAAQRSLELLRGPLEPFLKAVGPTDAEVLSHKPSSHPILPRPLSLKLYQIEQLTL